MGIIRVQHALQGQSNQPEDRYVNVFHFLPLIGSPSYSALATAIKGFYTTPVAPYSQAISQYLNGTADSAGASIKMYDLDDAKPRATVYEESYSPGTFGPGTFRNLPAEVAVCLSYSAAPASGVPISRRRGRIYIGPLSEEALASVTPSPGAIASRPMPALQNVILGAAVEMAETAAAADWGWVVYSPTNDSAAAIVTAWVDNAWDTQRRRGDKPTSRVTADII